MFSSRCMLFPTYKKNNWCTKINCTNLGGGGGRFFLEKHLILSHFISGFMLFSTITFFCVEILKSAPSLTGLNGRWFLQIVDRDSGNLYPLFSYSDLLSQMWGVGVGVGGNIFLHFMLFPTFLDKINSGNIKIIIFFLEKLFLVFNVLFVFSYYFQYLKKKLFFLEILKSAPLISG